MTWIYVSTLDVSDCMARLCNPQIGSVDDLNPFRVEITKLSDTQVYLVYKGRRFSKERRTEYLLLLLPDSLSSGTSITVIFQEEMFHLQCPMTPVSELDAFLKAAIHACRNV